MEWNPAARRRWRLGIAALLIAVSGLASLHRSLLEPSLGWRFDASASGEVMAEPMRPGLDRLRGVQSVEADGMRVQLTPQLVIESAGILNEYAQQDQFFAQHRRLWQVVHAPVVHIRHELGVAEVRPQLRTLGELGLRFWFPWVVALLSLSVGMAIWVYQPRQAAMRCYLIASSGYALGMLCTASWGSRLLTQPPTGWAELHVLSHLFSFMVTAGLCALLWLQPRRLGGNWMLWFLACSVAVLVAADWGQWQSTISLTFRLPIVLLTVVLGVLFVLQWRACRHDPTQRAQLKWFGLLMLVSQASVFVAYAFGAANRVPDIRQNYGLATVALLFLGLVPTVTRVGLFRLEAWWPRAWMWFLGGLLVVLLDLLVMAALGWGADKALALSLAASGWLYFPLRQAVWQRVARGHSLGPSDVLPRIVELVTKGHADRAVANQMWRTLWDEVFEPMHLRAAPASLPVGMHDDGRRLCVVAGSLEPLELELPDRGGRLFSPADARRAAEICALVQQGLAWAEAFENGARQERRRIASDLHDDLGAQLLTIAQGSMQWDDRGRVARLARQALEDMRVSLRGMAGEGASLAEVVADWRAETVGRLDAAGFRAQWHEALPARPVVLPARMLVQLTRVLRETVSNAIRHSGGSVCRIEVWSDGIELGLSVEDDGRGIPAEPAARGLGLANIERRVRSMSGTHAWSQAAGGGGTRLEVRVPLAASAPATA